MKSNGNGTGSLDDRLAALKSSSRQMVDPVDIGNFCRFELTVPRQLVIDVDESQALDFLRNSGVDALMKAVIGVRDIPLPRGETRGEISCSVDHEGHVSCGVSIHF